MYDLFVDTRRESVDSSGLLTCFLPLSIKFRIGYISMTKTINSVSKYLAKYFSVCYQDENQQSATCL